MGRLRDKLEKFEKGLIPMDDEIRAHIKGSKHLEYLRGKFEEMDFQDIIYQRYGEIREELGEYGSVVPAFIRLKEELESEGIDPEKYHLKDEPYHFNKDFTNWKTSQNKNK